MIISKIKISNFGCYAGDHELYLDPTIYAIVARHEQDPERSNFLGKSTLLEAIDFALYGRHSHRLEDGIITIGTTVSSVELVFDDGSSILRGRKIGNSTKLYWNPAQGTSCMGDAAQKIINQVIGLSPDDFLATCYFEQRQVARFILASPQERTSIVVGWLGLELVERAESLVRTKSSELQNQISFCDLVVNDNKRVMEAAFLQLGLSNDNSRDELVVLEQEATKAESLHQKVYDELREQEVQSQQWAKAFADAEQYDTVVAKGQELAVELRKLQVPDIIPLHDDLVARAAVLVEARTKLLGLQKVVKGEFDGRCPVAPLECPARAQINNLGIQATRAAQKARDIVTEALEAKTEATNLYGAAEDMVARKQKLETQLEGLRTRAQELRGSKKLVQDKKKPADMTARMEATHEDLLRATRRTTVVKQALQQYDQAEQKWQNARKQRIDFEHLLETHQEMTAILGKNGAQRRIAESTLQFIESEANAFLSDAGVDLSITILWSRDGQGWATSCEKCGQSFPTSTKVRECTKCKTVRGPKIISKLDIELSARSGAAEDLAGIAIQLAASCWLRNERSASWSVCMLDEPSAQLDRAHRRAITAALPRMLQRAGFQQAFIISHSPDMAECLPAHIIVLSNGTHAKLGVQ